MASLSCGIIIATREDLQGAWFKERVAFPTYTVSSTFGTRLKVFKNQIKMMIKRLHFIKGENSSTTSIRNSLLNAIKRKWKFMPTPKDAHIFGEKIAALQKNDICL